VSEVQTVQQKFVGVSFQRPKRASHRWIARVWTGSKLIAVPGRYDSALEAHEARLAFIAKLEAEAAAKVA
jgi:hypothetical protein